MASVVSLGYALISASDLSQWTEFAVDLLGLQIDLSRIVLDITAQAGAGNMLGNLLCGLTGILDPPTLAGPPLGQLTQILNALLALSPRTG